MNDLTFDKGAWDEYIYWQGQDKKVVKRINQLLKSIARDGVMQGIGKPEKLKHENGWYSRRIDDKNRLIYEVDELQNIKILACKGHYED